MRTPGARNQPLAFAPVAPCGRHSAGVRFGRPDEPRFEHHVRPNSPIAARRRHHPRTSRRAYTRGSAFAEFAEKEKGTLAPGKLADLAVLSQDIFQVAPPELPKTVSVLTLVGGKFVHDNGVLRRE